MIQLETRNATFQDFMNVLSDQRAARHDLVAPANAITCRGGLLHVADSGEPEITLDGVTTRPGVFRPTRLMDEQIADKLGIPVRYLRTLRDSRIDLYDANVNGWLQGRREKRRLVPGTDGGELVWDAAAADPRSFMVRTFRGSTDEPGIGRALLSDRYGVVDNYDFLLSALDGVKAAGVEVDITRCDISERRMYVRISAPGVAKLAPVLLAGYRSPYTGRAGADSKVVHAGFRIVNSETGEGKYSIIPEITVVACTNGLTFTSDAMTGVHLGTKLETGVIKWSQDTQNTQLELVTKKARDAVQTFLSEDYLTTKLAELERVSSTPVPSNAVELIAKEMKYTKEQETGILDFFIRGGQVTAGGVMQAITAYSQQDDVDADTAFELDTSAVQAMHTAARLQRA